MQYATEKNEPLESMHIYIIEKTKPTNERVIQNYAHIKIIKYLQMWCV